WISFVALVFDLFFCVFFFSSRRRHTRFKCDWSSDVCSSDLAAGFSAVLCVQQGPVERAAGDAAARAGCSGRGAAADRGGDRGRRSGERRVGEEGRLRGGAERGRRRSQVDTVPLREKTTTASR